MIASLLAQAGGWTSPKIDWHAVAPELVLIVGINIVLGTDLLIAESKKWATATITGFVLLAAFVPIVTLAVIGDDGARSLFDGRYVVDDFSLILKALFLLAAYVVVLISQTELEEHGYYQGEYYVLLLCSVLGMVMMASSRDLVSVFIALELLSIPAYMLAAWRKRDRRSNEAGVKYYLLGVFASAVLLYGMSLLYGATGSTKLTEIATALADHELNGLEVVAIAFVIAGFAFKVSAVPFHSWAPDTYEGAPTPVTAFLSVASKSAGFVALILVIFIAFPTADGVYGPLIWVLSALTMTVGNLIALRQTNIVRMLAYSSVGQGGFILMPLAFVNTNDAAQSALRAVVVYLLVYAFTNLGAFAVVIAVSRKTHSGEITSYGGLIQYAPGLAVMMTLFLASLTGIPPLGGWIGKFTAFKTTLDAGTTSAYVLAVIGAVNTAIAAALLPAGDARDVDERAARRRPHADRHPAPDRRRPGDHDGRHDRARRAAGARHALRRPAGPHRRPRPLMPAAGRAADDVRTAIAAAGGAIPFSTFMSTRPLRRRTASTRRRRTGRRAGAATSSRHPRSGRCSARSSRASSTPSGSGSDAPTRSRSSTPAPGRARWRAACSPPARRAAAALRYVAVEVSRRATGPPPRRRRVPVADLPDEPFDGVVLAHELLDNLPFRLVVHDGGWREALVTDAADGTFAEVLSAPFDGTAAGAAGAGGPRCPGAAAGRRRRRGWRRPGRSCGAARSLVVDYARPTTAELAALPWRSWLRTYRGHERGAPPARRSRRPGHHRRTSPLDQLPEPDAAAHPGAVPARYGIDELVDGGSPARGRRRRPGPDLAAMAMRSRVGEAEALLDPSGLGAFAVLSWDAGIG